jgi:hypothetical protein
MQCPHCLKHFHEKWNYTVLIQDAKDIWGAASTGCPACERAVITLGKMMELVKRDGTSSYVAQEGSFRLVYPKAVSRSPIPPELPVEFAADYREAFLVLPESANASAALSRRCLQHLLREKAGVKKGDLANEIQQVLDSKQLPTHMAEDLDAIRNIGNFASHPLKATNSAEIVDVEPGEAEWQLDVLEQLFDFYFVQPARSRAKRDALNTKLQAMGKPPMKGPPP